MSSRRTKAQRRAAKSPPAGGKRPAGAARDGDGRGAPPGRAARPRRDRRAPKRSRAPRQPSALTRLQATAAQAWRSALQSGLTAGARAPRPLIQLERPDFIWAAATGVASAIVFATILRGHPALGDGPESVGGIQSLGVLHAPGYPAYVIVGRIFTFLIPFGSAALKANLFSLVCASLLVAGVQLLARRCGAARLAATAAGLCLATGVGFWYYATFAKHDMFSGLLFLATLYFIIEYRAQPSRRWLVATAIALALGLGSSWPLEILLAPAIVFVLVRMWRQLSLRALLTATAAGAVVLVVVYGFVFVRAPSNPTFNFDRVTNLSRLSDLIGRADFTPRAAKAPAAVSPSGGGGGGAGGGASTPGVAPSPQPTGPSVPGVTPKPGGTFGSSTTPAGAVRFDSRLPTKLRAQGTMFSRELGVIGMLLAAWGVIAMLLLRPSVASYPLLIAFIISSLGSAAAAGVSDASSVDANLIEEGFIMGAILVLAVWLAIGATDLISRAGALIRSRMGGDPLLRHVRDPRWATALRSSPLAVLTAILVIPQLAGHWSDVHRSTQPYADRFATTVLNQLPHNAVVVFPAYEITYPAVYRQIVYHQRRDVVVLDLYSLAYPWYRANLAHRLHERLPPRIGDSILDARRIAKWLGQSRPVFMDSDSAQTLAGINPFARQVKGDEIGYQQVGLLAELTGGVGPGIVSSPSAVDQAFRSAERAAGMPSSRWLHWPNSLVGSTVYSTASLEVARGYSQHHDNAGLRSALRNALSIDPSNFAARAFLYRLGG